MKSLLYTYELAKAVVAKAIDAKVTLVTAESCTGGLLGGAITSIAGSSAIFDRGFITYSNQSKIDLLGVDQYTIESYGAVSENVAKEMAIGAKKQSKDQDCAAISVTGIAGPGGGTESKPVGLVWIAIHYHDKLYTYKNIFPGDRTTIRAQTVDFCLTEFLRLLSL